MKRKIILALVFALFFITCLCGWTDRPDSVNRLAQGSNQIEVRFLDNEKKSDASLVLVRTEQGTTVMVVDGGLATGRCRRELEQLRETWLADAGLGAEADNADLRLHVTLVVTHFHRDHVAELVKRVLPDEYLAVDALYLCEESAFPDAYTPNESTWREPLLKAMEKYAPDAEIITVPFNTAVDIALPYGTARLFGPCRDYGTAENRALLADLYYPDDSEDELKMELSTAVLNANSLFLRVATSGGSVLFTGDVMKKSADWEEPLDQMIERYGEELRSDIVKYPHHGQKRNAAASAVSGKLMNPGGISVLTGPESAKQAGKALDRYGAPWVDASEVEQVFVLTDSGWARLTDQ